MRFPSKPSNRSLLVVADSSFHERWENDQKFWHERYITPVGACKSALAGARARLFPFFARAYTLLLPVALDHGNRIFLNTNGLTDPRRNSENYTFVDGKFKYRNLDPLLGAHVCAACFNVGR